MSKELRDIIATPFPLSRIQRILDNPNALDPKAYWTAVTARDAFLTHIDANDQLSAIGVAIEVYLEEVANK